MTRAILSALLLTTLALPAQAQTAPTLTPLFGPCAGAQMLFLPYLSVQGSAQSAISFVNPSGNQNANVQACAYDQQGNLLGATSFQIGPSTYFQAVSGGSAPSLDLGQFFNGASLPTGAPFNAVFASDTAIQIQGAVTNAAAGPGTVMESPAMAGTVIASTMLGLQTQGQGYLFVANTSGVATTVSIDLAYSDGTGQTGLGMFTVAAYGSAVATISDLLSAAHVTAGQGLFTIRATSIPANARLAAWSVIAAVASCNGAVVALPLQVVSP